jgi:hypothetical protein
MADNIADSEHFSFDSLATLRRDAGDNERVKAIVRPDRVHTMFVHRALDFFDSRVRCVRATHDVYHLCSVRVPSDTALWLHVRIARSSVYPHRSTIDNDTHYARSVRALNEQWASRNVR